MAEKISAGASDADRGVVICGSGVGVDVVANKFRGVRVALVASPDQAFVSRNDDDTNVLALAADFLDEETAKKSSRLGWRRRFPARSGTAAAFGK